MIVSLPTPEGPLMRKNWLPLVSGPALAIARVPRGYRTAFCSAGSFLGYWLVGYSLANR